MELHSIHTSWLIPDEKTPCDILFYFKGNYVVGLKSGTVISLDFMAKLLKTEHPLAYISIEDQSIWNSWTALRHPHLTAELIAGKEENPKATLENPKASKYGNKRAEFLSYLQKAFVIRNSQSQSETELSNRSVAIIKNATEARVFDFFFLQFHEPPDIFHHNARVCYLVTYLALESKLLTDQELLLLNQATLIHELSGDPASAKNIYSSEETLKRLEKEKTPIAKEVIDLIRQQDELVSGQGFPQKLKKGAISKSAKLFSVCNHFDHFWIQSVGASRRIKFDQCKKKMENKKSDFEPALYDLLWKILEKNIEVIG